MCEQTRNFDKDADQWDEKPSRVKLATDVANTIMRQIPLTDQMDLLDFGCGTGLVSLQLAPFVRSVTGTDTSAGMLARLDDKIESAGIRNVTTHLLKPGEKLRGQYDAIVSSMTLHHIKDTQALLVQMAHCLKPGGFLCIADLDAENGAFHDDPTGVHHNGFDRKELKAAFKSAGLSYLNDTTAAEISKPAPDGSQKTFTVFLVSGQKMST